MKISRKTSCNVLTIKQPRWKDRVVLLAAWKVGEHNEILIEQRRKSDDVPYFPNPMYMEGEIIKSFPLEKQYHGEFYAVPLQYLQVLEREDE